MKIEKFYIGLDIGGTKIMGALANSRGQIIRKLRESTPPGLEEGLGLIRNMVKSLAARREIEAVGAAIGGPLDYREGVVSPLHQPAWRNVPLKKIMESKYRCRFHVDVDTNAAALGEYRFAAHSASRLLYVTISTGIGGGFIINGEIYRGKNGIHPEVGHQSVNFKCSHPEKVICECGAPDCLEALASGNGIRRVYGKSPENLNDGEWDEVAYNLGQGIRNLAVIYAPQLIVLGGGIAIGRGELLATRISEVMERYLKIIPQPEIRLSKLGYETALYGAVALAMRGAV
ncbi:MAG: ROK family protein [Calditrichia bacterium]